jgi:hypothetical protein
MEYLKLNKKFKLENYKIEDLNEDQKITAYYLSYQNFRNGLHVLKMERLQLSFLFD